MIELLRSMVASVRRGRTRTTEIADGAKLIDHMDVFVDAYCPCGSQHLHRLTLVSTSECARCGRTIGIRSIVYYRSSPSQMPTPNVSVGYLLTESALARRPTRGVH
jgi:hypothetical protein